MADKGVPLQIQLKKISKHYQEGEQKQLILDEIDALINQGEVIALIGPSGSGKTTLLNLVSGIDEPDAGELLIHDKNDVINLLDMNEQQRTMFRRYNIGFIFQFFNLIPTLTVAENIQFPLELCNRLDNDNRNEVKHLLHKLKIQDKSNHYPDYLSGGEQQRVAIARAIIHRPKILLADEPTGNLDDETGRQVMNILLELTRNYNMTLLIVTHSQEVANRADRILTLKNGHLNVG